MVTAAGLAAARAIAAAVPDPELPMVTVADLGILRGVAAEGERLVVTITPTYSGCPALRTLTLSRPEPVPCPRCGSAHTTSTAAFGATACKALFRCENCREPFEYVKAI